MNYLNFDCNKLQQTKKQVGPNQAYLKISKEAGANPDKPKEFNSHNTVYLEEAWVPHVHALQVLVPQRYVKNNRFDWPASDCRLGLTGQLETKIDGSGSIIPR